MVSYTLVIESPTDVVLDGTSVHVSFKPVNHPLILGLTLSIQIMTTAQVKKFVASEIRTYYPKECVAVTQIQLLYRDQVLGTGNVLKIMKQIEAKAAKVVS